MPRHNRRAIHIAPQSKSCPYPANIKELTMPRQAQSTAHISPKSKNCPYLVKTKELPILRQTRGCPYLIKIKGLPISRQNQRATDATPKSKSRRYFVKIVELTMTRQNQRIAIPPNAPDPQSVILYHDHMDFPSASLPHESCGKPTRTLNHRHFVTNPRSGIWFRSYCHLEPKSRNHRTPPTYRDHTSTDTINPCKNNTDSSKIRHIFRRRNS